MEYLAVGLPAEQRRYMLCDNPEDDRWDELGIRPVGYPNHDVLPSVIERWVERSQMTARNHADRVRGVVEDVPDRSPEDEEYLEETVADPERVRFFTDHARGLCWLKWVTHRDQFQRVFEPFETAGDVGTTLAWWFCRYFVVNPALTDAALRVVGEYGGRLGPQLAARVVWAIRDADREAGFGGLHRWVSLAAAEDLPPGGRKQMWWLLRDCDPLRDRETLLLLFDQLAQPVPSLNGASLIPVVDPQVRSVVKESYWFEKVWRDLIKPNLEDLAADAAPIIDRHLRLAHRFDLVVDQSGVNPDTLSTRREAIEFQQRYGADTLDPLIDAARDVLEALLQHSPDEASRYLRSWHKSTQPLLWRLAIYGWTRHPYRDADEKLRWLLENVDIFDVLVHHEVNGLLETTLPEVSDTCGDMLVQHLVDGLDKADIYTEHDIYSYLCRVVQHGPQLASAQRALDRLQTAHPDWHPPIPSAPVIQTVTTPLPPVLEITPAELMQGSTVHHPRPSLA